MKWDFEHGILELPPQSEIVNQQYLNFLAKEYRLSHNGQYGIDHWLRVLINGRLIAETNGADIQIVEHFALLHDVMRVSEDFDPGHGERAGDFAFGLWGTWIKLSEWQVLKLRKICRAHSAGYISEDVTAQTCWDADRLDIGRLGIKPNPKYLATNISRQPDFLASAYTRSTKSFSRFLYADL